MGKKVQLTVKGIHGGDSGQNSTEEFTVEAEYFERSGTRYILYEERRENDRIPCTLKLKNGILELTKKDFCRTRMIFERGCEHPADYATPFGALRLGIRTEELDFGQTDSPLEIQADYCLLQEGQVFSRCKLIIKIQDLV